MELEPEHSTTSFEFESLVSVVGPEQRLSEAKVIELCVPPFETHRSLSCRGLSFCPLQTSHELLIWQHKCPPHCSALNSPAAAAPAAVRDGVRGPGGGWPVRARCVDQHLALSEALRTFRHVTVQYSYVSINPLVFLCTAAARSATCRPWGRRTLILLPRQYVRRGRPGARLHGMAKPGQWPVAGTQVIVSSLSSGTTEYMS